MTQSDKVPVGEIAVTPKQLAVGPKVDVVAAATVSDMAATIGEDAVLAIEGVELDPRLKTFKADFDADPVIGAKCSWEEIQDRLFANEGHYLALAQAMEQGGQLFGVDAEGRPLICDRGDEPIMKGMNYPNTRNRVLYKHDKNDINGKLIAGEDGKPQSTGYEMFPYSREYDKSDEIYRYESHTEKDFVQSTGVKGARSSWLESGENPFHPRDVRSNPDLAHSRVGFSDPGDVFELRGVRRLLRLEKAA